MTILETAVFLILLLMALPDFCRRIHRPGLIYPLYIVAGIIAGAFMGEETRTVWREIGQFGFILLLFSVGLEIELPEKRESLVALRRAALWLGWQLPLLVGLGYVAGIGWSEGLVAGCALASTSVGMAFNLWRRYPFVAGSSRKEFLEWIVAVEVLSIFLLAVAGPVIQGAVWWRVVLQLTGVVTAAVVAAILAVHGAPRIGAVLARGLHLQVHLLVALLFGIAALGERLGLSAPKTAFVLGMFISRATDEEADLNERLEPIRDRLFVPVFFFALGGLVEPRLLLSSVVPMAIGAGLVLFGARKLVYRWVFARLIGTEPSAHVIAAPMLTIAAVAVEVLARAGASERVLTWILAAGLCLTLIASFFRVSPDQARISELEPEVAAPEAWDQADAAPAPSTQTPQSTPFRSA